MKEEMKSYLEDCMTRYLSGSFQKSAFGDRTDPFPNFEYELLGLKYSD